MQLGYFGKERERRPETHPGASMFPRAYGALYAMWILSRRGVAMVTWGVKGVGERERARERRLAKSFNITSHKGTDRLDASSPKFGSQSQTDFQISVFL
jgi:hypothetical protein